jgi:hypothetical protein
MNTGEHIYQSLVDTVVKLSVTWIDRMDTDMHASDVLQYTRGALGRHFKDLCMQDYAALGEHLMDIGMIDCMEKQDVYNCVWNCIEIELSKLYA